MTPLPDTAGHALAGISGVDRARLRPPRPRAGVVARAALTRRPVADAPVVLIEAEAGYGKTTAADLLTAGGPRAWYSLGPADRDPRAFLAHLIVGLDEALRSDGQDRSRLAVDQLAQNGAWPHVLDELIDGLDHLSRQHRIVLDDYHLVAGSRVDDVVARLIDRLPRTTRLVIATRREVSPQSWARSRAYGNICRIGCADLAFTMTETDRLFRSGYGVALTDTQARLLLEETEGWPIALSLLAQQLVERDLELEALLAELPDNRATVFGYLGSQVLAAASDEVRDFLTACCGLDVIDAAACSAVAAQSPPAAAALLDSLGRNGVFCTSIGAGQYRLHQLFREYLRAGLSPERSKVFDRRAAAHFRSTGRLEEAARHSMRAGDDGCAARDLSQFCGVLNSTGRYLTLLALTDQLSIQALREYPELLVARSVALRLTSRYPGALSDAADAQRLLPSGDLPAHFAALVSEAAVYLDTVQPSAARASLARAGRLARRLDDEHRAKWRGLVAENLVNEGRLGHAERAYQRLAAGPSHDHGRLRLLVRQGDLHRALAAMDARAESDGCRIPQAHREDQALLAWTYALLGDGERAERHARNGTELGERLSSPIVSCVCTGRIGLARLCADDATRETALEPLRAALAAADAIDVPRFRAEPLIGLTVYAGHFGEFSEALRHGLQALDTLIAAGDSYLAAIATLAIGTAAARQRHPSAADWLSNARRQAQRCGDAYVPLVADAWLAYLALLEGDLAGFADPARRAMAATASLALDEIWTAAPWLGMVSAADRARWLDAATSVSGAERYSRYLVARTAPPRGHSGDRARPAQLHITTFGRFSVRREGAEIDEHRWTRRKALEMLWLLCIRDHHSIGREEAAEVLWPDGSAEASNVRFRVALHALRQVLEPDRAARSGGALVKATPERITLTDNVRVDLDQFWAHAKTAETSNEPAALDHARAAIDLYQGPFLAEAPYVEWLEPTRRSCQTRFINLCERVAGADLAVGDYHRAAATARRILDEDPYHERAYRILAQAHLLCGDRAAAQRTYADCRQRLATELGVEPSWSLAELSPTDANMRGMPA